MLNVEETYEQYKNIMKHRITIRNLAKPNKINYVFEISKLKLNLINIIKCCGAKKIDNILKLILKKNEIKEIQKNHGKIIKLYDNYFNPTSFILYTKNDEINLIKEASNINNNYPICLKNKDIKFSLIEKLLGSNIYIPVNNKLILIKGYFNQDPINITRT